MNEIEQAKQTSKNVKEQELEAKQALKHLKNKLSMSLKDIPVKPITPIQTQPQPPMPISELVS